MQGFEVDTNWYISGCIRLEPVHTAKLVSETNLDYDYIFLIDLAPNRILFGTNQSNYVLRSIIDIFEKSSNYIN